MTRPERITIEEHAEFVASVANWLAVSISAAVAERGSCALALSGGSTPRPIYTRLAERHAGVPWGRVDIFFGDERCVPPDDVRSNYHMANETLLSRVPVLPERVYRMEGELPDEDAAAHDYERLLPERLDVLLLGIGADGHTASLFPGAPELDERVRSVLPSRSPEAPRDRLTITPPVIARARRVAVIVAGAEKALAAARAIGGDYDPRMVPVQLALGGSWFFDSEAAAALGTAAR